MGVALVDKADAALIEGPKWHLDAAGYARRQLSKGTPPNRTVRTILMHRLIMGVGPGEAHVDHINGNRLDNRRANLRLVSRAQQSQNVRRRPKTSKYRGVSREGNRWVAKARLDGKMHHLGSFQEELQAAHAAAEFRREHMTHTVEEPLPPAPPIVPWAPKPPSPCTNCGRLYKPLRKGRCAACNTYLRKTGRERPYGAEDGRRAS